MSRILIVAHPDDEILWFNPTGFEKIYVVFCGRHDRENFSAQRKAALKAHPLATQINLLDFDEPGYWKDTTRHAYFEKSKNKFLDWLYELKKNTPSEIFTHNELGEYGHSDHILVSNCVNEIFSQFCPIWMPTIGFESRPYEKRIERQQAIDLDQFVEIRNIYLQHKVWTWNLNFFPPLRATYYTKNVHLEVGK